MTALAMAAVITHYDRVRQAPMDVPITWSQTTTYVRKCGGRWWVATCLFVDPTYAMAQQAGHVIDSTPATAQRQPSPSPGSATATKR